MSLIRIALAGEGGQGVQSVAEILTEAAYNENQQTIYIPNFGLEQRGGVSIAFIQFSDKRIGAPKFNKADAVIALSGRAIGRTAGYNLQFLLLYQLFLDSEIYIKAFRKKSLGFPTIKQYPAWLVGVNTFCKQNFPCIKHHTFDLRPMSSLTRVVLLDICLFFLFLLCFPY
jgi:hypothetical protein